MRRARSRQAPPPSWGGAAARPVRRRCPRSGGQRLPGKPRRHGGKNSPLFAHFAEQANYVWRVLAFLFEQRLVPRLRLVCESTRDRKRVVWGQSVSVRVSLGGRGSMKIKKN